LNQYRLSPEFACAFVRAQGQIEGAVKGSMNPAFRSKYADLGAVWEAIREALQNNGLAVAQFPCEAPAGHIGLETILVYGKTGECFGRVATIPFKDPTNPQAAGSAYTYLRRYALSAVMGVCPEDDDGQKASREVPRRNAMPTTEPPSLPEVSKDHSKKNNSWEPVPENYLSEAIDRFSRLDTVDLMKDYYNKVRTGRFPEHQKTELLKAMGNMITERKGQIAQGMSGNSRK